MPIRSTSATFPRPRTCLRRTSSGPFGLRLARRRIATFSAGRWSAPTEHFYGTDFGLRDPFGNNIRVVQLATVDNGLPKTLDAPKAAKA